MFPSSKKKRLCCVNRPISIDRGILVCVDSNDSTDELDDWEEILSTMVPIDKSEGAVMTVSEEVMVDADGDLGESCPVIGVVWGCWAMIRPGSA
jgi:hypothetical protein